MVKEFGVGGKRERHEQQINGIATKSEVVHVRTEGRVRRVQAGCEDNRFHY